MHTRVRLLYHTEELKRRETKLLPAITQLAYLAHIINPSQAVA